MKKRKAAIPLKKGNEIKISLKNTKKGTALLLEILKCCEFKTEKERKLAFHKSLKLIQLFAKLDKVTVTKLGSFSADA